MRKVQRKRRRFAHAAVWFKYFKGQLSEWQLCTALFEPQMLPTNGMKPREHSIFFSLVNAEHAGVCSLSLPLPLAVCIIHFIQFTISILFPAHFKSTICKYIFCQFIKCVCLLFFTQIYVGDARKYMQRVLAENILRGRKCIHPAKWIRKMEKRRNKGQFAMVVNFHLNC